MKRHRFGIGSIKQRILLGVVSMAVLMTSGCGSGDQPAADPAPEPQKMSQEEACQVLGSGQDKLEADLENAGIPLDSSDFPTEEPARTDAQQALQKYRDSWVDVRDNGPEPIATEMHRVLTAVDTMGFFTPGEEYTPEPADTPVMQDGYEAMLSVTSTCDNPELFGQMTSPSDS